MKNVLERLLNLLAMLLTASRPVTASQIRRTIPGYSQDSDDAFHRMFERDKDLLRSIGVPLEMVYTDGWEVEQGYLVDPGKYSLADPGLTDEERAALLLAAQVVRLGGEGAGPEAMLKLGGTRLTGAAEPLAADLGASPLLGELFGAVSERRPVNITYRGKIRRINPYGLGHRRGHWYLVGGTGDGERMFRVDRIEALKLEGEPGAFKRPRGFRIKAALADLPWEAGPDDGFLASVRFSPEVAWWAARQLGASSGASKAGQGPLSTPNEGLVAEITVSNVEAFLGWVLSFGVGAEVLGPPALREAVIERIRGGS